MAAGGLGVSVGIVAVASRSGVAAVIAALLGAAGAVLAVVALTRRDARAAAAGGLVAGCVALALGIGGLARGSGAEAAGTETPTAPPAASELPTATTAPTASEPPTATLPPTFPTERSVFELAVGDCFDEPDTAQGVQTVPLVDCAGPHDSEVFALIAYPAEAGEPYPGAEVVQEFGDESCRGEAFTAYVDQEYDLSALFASTLVPSEESWTQADDREIVCILYNPSEPLVGSQQGSGA